MPEIGNIHEISVCLFVSFALMAALAISLAVCILLAFRTKRCEPQATINVTDDYRTKYYELLKKYNRCNELYQDEMCRADCLETELRDLKNIIAGNPGAITKTKDI